VVTKAQPIACPKSQLSPPAPAACTPVIVASHGSLIARIWRLGCPAQIAMRDNGVVTYAYNGGRYAVSDRHLELPGRPLPLGEAQTTTVGMRYRLLVDGHDYALEHADVCERFPASFLHADPNGTTIATSADGTLTAWAIDASGGYHELERASDDTWRVYPALRSAPSPAIEMFVQSGRVVSAYRSAIGGDIEEVGYLDAQRRLQPIRRIPGGSLDAVIPGETTETPPAAIEIQSGQPTVDVLDREHGYRRTAITDPERSCPREERSSTGFAHRSPARLFRSAGTLWVAYAVWSGDCKYEVVSSAPRMSPFLFAHPPPSQPMPQAIDVIHTATLILMAVDGPRRGTTLRETLPHVPFAGSNRDNPVVDDARVRLVLGDEVIDLDAAKLAAR